MLGSDLSDRALTVLIGLALSCAAAYLVYYIARVDDAAQREVSGEAVSRPERRPGVTVQMLECRRRGDKVEVTGYVENTGTVDLTHVTVQTLFKTKAGLALRTGVAYAVDGEPLVPGTRREFSDATNGSRVASCRVEILDFWSGTTQLELERATRFELATASLGSWGSTN